jgi:hypothetical protein
LRDENESLKKELKFQRYMDELLFKFKNLHLDNNRLIRRISTPSSASASGATPSLAAYSYAATMANLYKLICLSNAKSYLICTMGNFPGY